MSMLAAIVFATSSDQIVCNTTEFVLFCGTDLSLLSTFLFLGGAEFCGCK